MKNKLNTLILTSLLVIIGCDKAPLFNPHEKQTVTVYEQTNIVNSGNNNSGISTTDILFWYLIMNNNNQYIYASSHTQVSPSSYSSLNWQTSKTPPVEIEKPDVEKVETEQVENEDLGKVGEQEVQSEEQMEFNFENNESSQSSETESSSSSSDSGGDSGGSSGD